MSQMINGAMRSYYPVLPLLLILQLAGLSGCSKTANDTIPVQELSLSWLWDPSLEHPDDWQIIESPGCLINGPGNHLFLSDIRAARITRFTAEARSIEIIGSRGAGPGEFQFPRIQAYDYKTDILWVTDVNLGRIIRFKIYSDGSEFLDSHPSNVVRYLSVPSLIPDSTNTYWTIGFATDHRIKHMSLNDEVLIEFGEPWVIDGLNPWNVDLLNRGLLVPGGNDRLIYVWRTKPVIELWTKDGNLLLDVTLDCPEIGTISEQYENQDNATLGTDWVPMYIRGAVSRPEEKRLFLSIAIDLESPYVIYELSIPDFSVIKIHSLINRPEYFFPSGWAISRHDKKYTFFILDEFETGIAVLSPVPQ